jgi:hypothetical protein
MYIHWIQWIGIAFFIIGTILMAVGQGKSANERNQQLSERTTQIVELSRENALLSKKNTDLNERLSDYVTGNSFCVVDFERFDEGLDIVNVTITNEGKNPLYELVVTIKDIGIGFKGGMLKNVAAVYEALKNDLTVSYPIIPPGRGRMHPMQFPFFKKSDRIYNITCTSRYGDFVEYYRGAQVNGQWKKAILVFRKTPKEPLYEKIDSDFPRDATGEIKWD